MELRLLRSGQRWAVFGALLVTGLGLSWLAGQGVRPEPPDGAGPLYGTWLAVTPPLVAVLLAAVFRQVFFALGTAVVAGAFLSYADRPLMAPLLGFQEFVWSNISDPFNLFIMGFVTLLFGLIHVTSKNGGMAGLIDVLSGAATSPRSARLTTAGMGLAIFFDDYSNSLLVGTTMRKVTDAYRISRAKLAYIVDSTAAPIAGLAPISTWIAYEVSILGAQTERLGLGVDGYALFQMAVPVRFYCWTALAFVVVNAWLGRDYGPMHGEESIAATTGHVHGGRDDAESLNEDAHLQPPEGTPLRWWNAVIPVGLVIVLAIGGLLWSGSGAVAEAGLRWNLLSGEVWQTALGGANSAKVLFFSGLTASILALLMTVSQGILKPIPAVKAYFSGLDTTALAIGILVLAWAIKACSSTLGTDVFLIELVGDTLPPFVLPLLIFLLAALIAFATGTSWGTMGILLPIALPLAHSLEPGSASILFVLTTAAVLDGAIFGDHCSPLSDTTVLSSIASGCDHIEHVRTQMPYAITSMLAAGSFGYIGVALGLPLLLAHLLSLGAITAALLLLGRPVR